MFTGLVEGLGQIVALKTVGPGVDLTLRPVAPLPEQGSVNLGDSIAINGCCLTVVGIDGDDWTFQAGRETLSRTNLGELQVGHRVNLERALRANDRLGGHFVQGHVDAIGTVKEIQLDGEWINLWFEIPHALTRQMVGKGSVTVDGVSLTVVSVTENRFSVALIPHTLQATTLGLRQVKDLVNIETDILGKYIEKLLQQSIPPANFNLGSGDQ